MRIARGALAVWIALASLAALALPADAADGLGLTPHTNPLTWPRWQARIALGHTAPVWRAGLGGFERAGLRPASLSLMGDYYFTDPLLGGSGGFRATSGVIVGLRWPDRSPPALGDATPETATTPYLGLGYTGLSNQGSLRYSADLGLLAQPPGGSAVRLGRSAAGSIDDLLRDVRLGPVFQLGVSYSF